MNNKELYNKLDNLVSLSNKYDKEIYTNFLDELELVQANNYIKVNYNISNIPINGTKKVISINSDPNNNIICLVSYYNNDFIKLKHSDVLGALYKLNYSKSVIGDIYVFDDKIVIYTLKSIYKDIILNLNRINRVNVLFSISDINYYKEQEYIDSTINVSSYRLDSIVKGISNVSRNKALELIKDNCIKVNHIVCTKHTKTINYSDIISIKGYGRYIIDSLSYITSKDRIVLNIKKYN